MGLLFGKRRISGRILHVREILGNVRIEIEVGKASAASLFTGTIDYGRLRGKIASITTNKIDTRKAEVQVLKAERKAKLKAMKQEKKLRG